MPPPPVTPSPHRFIVKEEAPSTQLRPLARPYTHSASQQFNATPRFAYSSSVPQQSLAEPAREQTPGGARFSTPGQTLPRAQDVIEDFPDNLSSSLAGSIENHHDDLDEELHYLPVHENDFKLEEPTRKRQRLTSPLLFDEEKFHGQPLDDYTNNDKQEESSYMPTISSPPRPKSSGRHKFVIPTPTSPSLQSFQSTPSTFLKPPRFLPPDPLETDVPDPLPEQFSPHRKGHKYLSGGLAAEARDWLANMCSSVPATKNMHGSWIVRILVDEVSGGRRTGMTLVKGRDINEDAGTARLGLMKVILAGGESGIGMQAGTKIEAGKVIGIKGPRWEIVVEGESCGVAVEWKVLYGYYNTPDNKIVVE